MQVCSPVHQKSPRNLKLGMSTIAAPNAPFARGGQQLNERPPSRISPSDLENLLATLDVNFVGLSECLVGRGYSLELGGVNAPGIHYNIVGTGRAVIGDREAVPLVPHTLIVLPPNSPFRIEVEGSKGFTGLRRIRGEPRTPLSGTMRRVAGDGEPSLMLVCGYFHATYGASTDLFCR